MIMRCPHCNKEMKHDVDVYWTIGDWDSESPSGYTETYYCKYCKIKATNNNPVGSNFEWDIPEHLRATDKQIKTAMFINRYLRIAIPPSTKRALWLYIHKYLQEAVIVKENDFTQWCEDNQYWLSDFECEWF